MINSLIPPTTPTTPTTPSSFDAQVPNPPSERGAWLLAIALGALGVGVLIAVLTGAIGATTRAAPAASPPPVLVAATTPVPGAGSSASVLAGAAGPRGSSAGSHRRRSIRGRRSHAAAIVA